MKRTLYALALALSCLYGYETAESATVLLRNTDGPGEGLNDPTPIAAVGGNPATTRGQARRNVINEALRIWGALLESNQTIILDAGFEPMQCSADSGQLGGAGPTNYYRDFANAAKPNTWYPSALADALAGANISEKYATTAGLADITARFNSNVDTATCLRGRGYYYGIDGKPGKQTHLLEVALHEIGHGLGFASLVNPKTGASYATSTDNVERLSIYDHFVFDEFLVKPWTQLSAGQRAASAVRRGFLTWSGANANARTNRLSAGFNSLFRLQLYSPPIVAPGSSVSHWDTSATGDLLMEPFETAVVNQTTDLTVCAFRDLGWKTTKCPDPLNNAVPTATPFTLSVTEDTPKIFILTVKDDDLDPLTATFPTAPTRGNLSPQGTSASSPIEYRPNTDANGADTFTVVVHDGIAPSAAVTINVNIAPVNDAPTSKAISATTQGAEASITLAGSDVDGDALTYTIVTQPVNGTLSGTPPNLVYRANASFTGKDSFTYRVSDASLSSAPATVSINAAAPPPVTGGGSGGGGALELPSLLLLLWALGLHARGRVAMRTALSRSLSLQRARKLAQRLLGTGVLITLVTACGGGSDSPPALPTTPVTPPTTPTPPVPTPPTPPAAQPKATAPQSATYAEVVRLSLVGLGLPDNLDAAQLSVKSGTADSLAIRDGEIRFITPTDPGTDQTVELRALVNNEEIVVPVTVRSFRPTEVFADIEASESGGDPIASPPKLTVTGLGPGNALVGGALVLTVANNSPLDPLASAATIYVPNANQVLDLAKVWSYDAAARSLTVSSSAMATLLASLPSEDVEVSVSLVSPDGKFASAYVFAAHKPRAVIAGQIRDFNGAAVTNMANAKVAARGLDNRTAKVAVVDSAGKFEITGLVDGTYEISVLSVDQPGFVTTTVPIYVTTTTANVQLTLAPPAPPTAFNGTAVLAVFDGSSTPGALLVSAGVVQDGIPPVSRGPLALAAVQPMLATPASCETASASEITYTVSAAAKDSTIACVIAHTVPKGTANLGIRVSIATAEYPTYTQSKSQYNDSWSYSIAGIPGAVSAGGQVNDSHYTTGVINRDICANVASLTAANAFVLNARIAATNIGDSALATQVTMRVSSACPTGLKVTQATMTSPNGKNYSVVSGSGNDNYVSLPITTDFADWGIPAEVRYEPTTATIARVRVGVMVNGQATMSDFNLLDQATTNTPGRLVFNNLRLPRLPIALFAGKTNVLVELTGTLNGAAVGSKPEDAPFLFGGKRAFTPLFLAADQFNISRRYGTRDAGGDSWAASKTVFWLQGRAYRFDDISALHSARFSVATACPSAPENTRAAGDSVLCHKGHSDGRQVDLRYADGSGGYADALGGLSRGASIKKMLEDAFAETALAATAPKPNLTTAKNWIMANRAMAELEAAQARKIHFGPDWMKLALMDGRFPNGTAIPGIAAWTTKPSVVGFVVHHLNHWHMSLKE